MELLDSPLHERHEALGAKFAEFGGWSMPLEYANQGVLAEHRAVRDAVGIFDVSHLGKVRVRGAGARDFLNRCFTNDLAKVASGEAQYTLVCDENGGTIDDLIAYVRADDEVFLIPNAANAAEVVHLLRAAAPSGIDIVDEHHDHAIIAIQGPASVELLSSLGVAVDHRYMSFVETAVAGVEVTCCRTGYTGERGYELVVPRDQALAVWDALRGSEVQAMPCGLAARDTLRTEMGYPLHGNDLSREISGVMARLSWAIAWDKPEFWGKIALAAQRHDAGLRSLRGLRSLGRGIPRPGMEVTDGDGTIIGTLTTGTFSPTLRQGIGLALLDRDVADGAQVTVEIRGKSADFEVTRPPFITVSTKE